MFPRVMRSSRGLLALIAAAFLVAACAAPEPAVTPELISADRDGVRTGATSPMFGTGVSADGSVVAFMSASDQLVDGETNGLVDVFVRDRGSGTTTRVSVASDGTEATGGDSGLSGTGASVSADGRFVAFASFANNLVPDDTNDVQDVFVHDRSSGSTRRVSVGSDGTEGDLPSFSPTISADGRFVAFESNATNLVEGDTNGIWDVFVHDLATGTTERVSVASDGTQGTFYRNRFSILPWSVPTLSADGRYVAFVSYATGLVPGDTHESSQVYLHDRVTGETSLVSESMNGGPANQPSHTAFISADGRYVAFDSSATDLVGGPPMSTNQSDPWNAMYLRDLDRSTTTAIGVAWHGLGRVHGFVGSISADGRYVAFESDSTELFVPDRGYTEGASRVFLTDTWYGTTRTIAPERIDGDSVVAQRQPSVSADARTVVFVASLQPTSGPLDTEVYAVG